MSDLISRQAALDAISTFGNREYRRKQGTLQDAYKLISALPSANKSGKWIHDTHYGLNLPEHKCSECGTWEYSDEESNFCPHCGADMRGGDNETD